MIEIILLIIVALVALSVLVLVHEFGHFIVAKKSGVWVEEFGIGLPPRAWGKKIGETIYSVNWLPLGGFVRLHGEVNEEGVTKPKRAFVNKSAKVKIAVALAGIFMNYLFAIVAFTLINFNTGIPTGNEIIGILESSPGSPAEEAGLIEGDNVFFFNDIEITNADQFVELVDNSRGKEVTLLVSDRQLAGSDKREVMLIPRESPPEGEGALGIAFAGVAELYKPSLVSGLFLHTQQAVWQTWQFTELIVLGLFGIFGEVSHGQAPEGVAGPVGIVATFAEIFRRLGFLPLLEFTAIVSINLALINLVPFPPLDGSRVMFVVFESIFGENRVNKMEAKIHTVGMAILLFLILIITATEIPKAFSARSLSGFVEAVIGF